MKHYREVPVLSVAALLASGFIAPAVLSAAPAGDSEEIAKLLAEAKTEAVQLKHDAEEMHSFAQSRLSWRSHASKVTMVKEHINQTGKLLAQLQDLASTGSEWQRSTIERIDPLLRELAANTEATIKHLNENHSRVHLQEFRDYVRVNYELAGELESMISKAVDYGEAKEKFDRFSKELEPTS